MKIINNVTEDGYIQWIENFVSRAIKKAKLKCQEVVIEDIEWSKRVFLKIDGEDYNIRTWNFHVVECDENDVPCAEIVDYTLYKMIWEEDEEDELCGGHGEEIGEGKLVITWNNNLSDEKEQLPDMREKVKEYISDLDVEIDRLIKEQENLLKYTIQGENMISNVVRAKTLLEVKNDLQSRLKELV